jgi:hypothetical protein
MRITALLQKIHELASQPEPLAAIDLDLMLDYTRVLYSDLLEWRAQAQRPVLPEPAATPEPEVPAPAPAPAPMAITPVQLPEPEPEPEPAPAEPTLEEYMAIHAGRSIQREATALAERQQMELQLNPAEDEDEEPVVIATAQHPEPVIAAAPPAPKPGRDIRGMIGINDKYQIMSELFGNDKAAYEQALDQINRAESEQAAFNWLRERLWVTEDHSDAAMIFFDVVRRFKNG